MRLIATGDLDNRSRYQLMTSLVVPRPIAWISSRSPAGVANLAPFSYYAGVSASPMLIAVSIGQRRGQPKDSLLNIRATRAFCINLVTLQHLEAMNLSAGEYAPDVDEFEVTGAAMAEASSVIAPYVADAPAVMECRLFKEVDLDGATTSLILGEVVAVRLREDLQPVVGSAAVDVLPLIPVGRLWGELYSPVRETVALKRPVVDSR